MPSILRTPILRKFHNYTGDVITQGSVTIVNTPSGSTATIYSSETGIGTTSQPLALQSDGGVDGWLEIGIYDITAATSIGTVTSRYYSNHPRQSLLQGTALIDDQFQINDDNDTVSRLSVNGGGTISWSSGTAAADASLYRLGSGTLGFNSSVIAYPLSGNVPAFGGRIVGDTVSRVAILGNGTVEFGAGGSSARDANLYRLSAGLLKTDSSLTVAGSATVSGTLTAETLTATSGTFSGTISATSGTFSGTISATSGTFSGTISASYGTVGTGGLIVTGNKTVSGTSFYPDGTSAAPSITFTNSSTTGLWRDTNGLNSTFLVSNRNIERGTAVPTIAAPGTLTAAQFVGKSVNDGGLIFVNLSPAGTITLPTAGSVYSEFGYTGAIFSVTISNIGATLGTVALNTGFAEYTGIAFPYALAIGASITIKNHVLNSGSVILVAATT